MKHVTHQGGVEAFRALSAELLSHEEVQLQGYFYLIPNTLLLMNLLSFSPIWSMVHMRKWPLYFIEKQAFLL